MVKVNNKSYCHYAVRRNDFPFISLPIHCTGECPIRKLHQVIGSAIVMSCWYAYIFIHDDILETDTLKNNINSQLDAKITHFY